LDTSTTPVAAYLYMYIYYTLVAAYLRILWVRLLREGGLSVCARARLTAILLLLCGIQAALCQDLLLASSP
jgi:hypothetical protein